MHKTKYIAWSRAMILSNILSIITWTSLTSFMLMAKNSIGIEVIPIFEMLIFTVALVGIKVAHSKWVSLKGGLLSVMVQESIFLIALYITLLSTNNLAYAGYIVYGVIMGSAVLHKISDETRRSYEQAVFNTPGSNKVLKHLRKVGDLTTTIGGAIGTGVAVVCISILHINIINFTLVMLILNIVQNLYEYYLWFKYIR